MGSYEQEHVCPEPKEDQKRDRHHEDNAPTVSPSQVCGRRIISGQGLLASWTGKQAPLSKKDDQAADQKQYCESRYSSEHHD